MEYNQYIKTIKEIGYASADRFLSKEDLDYLKKFIYKRLNDNVDVNKTSDTTPVLLNLLGSDKNFDKIIEKIISNNFFDRTAKSLLGENYKIWEVSSRVSNSKDSGLSMHQDAPGQMNFWLLLNDQNDKSGVTGFLPKSHQFPRIAKKISWANIKIAKYFLEPLLGNEGDFAFFINRSWHARLPNNLKKNNETLAIGMFAEGSSFTPSAKNFIIDPITCPNLYNRISLTGGKIIDSVFYINKTEDNNFLINIEKINKFSLNKNSITTVLLHLIFYPVLILKKLISLYDK